MSDRLEGSDAGQLRFRLISGAFPSRLAGGTLVRNDLRDDRGFVHGVTIDDSGYGMALLGPQENLTCPPAT